MAMNKQQWMDLFGLTDAQVSAVGDVSKGGVTLDGTGGISGYYSSVMSGNGQMLTGSVGGSLYVMGNGKTEDTLIGASTGTYELYGGGVSDDRISIGGDAKGSIWYGIGDGDDVVEGFKVTGDSGDKLNLYNSTLADLKRNGFVSVDDDGFTVNFGTNHLSVQGGTADSVTGAQMVNTVLKDGASATLWLAKKDSKVSVGAGTDLTNQVFIGQDSISVNFGNYTNDLDVSLDSRVNGGQYQNVNSIVGGTGNNVLSGNDGDNFISAEYGTGTALLWGGAKGNDTLKGGDRSADTFKYGKAGGKDVIDNFQLTDVAGDKPVDTLWLYDAKLSDASVVGDVNGAQFQFGKAADNNVVSIKGASSNTEAFNVKDSTGATYQVMIGKNAAMEVNDGTDIYFGSQSSDSLNGSKGSADMDIYLANDLKNTYQSTMFTGVNNVSGGAGNNILRGNDKNNILDNSAAALGTYGTLWGGKGNDSMVGGDGADQFNFGKNDGLDSIKNFTAQDGATAAADTLLIYDAKLADVKVSAAAGTNNVTLGIDARNAVVLEGVASDTDAFKVVDGEGVSRNILVGTNGAGTGMAYGEGIDAYYGNSANAKLDGSAATADMDIYLANDLKNTYQSAMFVGVNDVTGGAGNNILRGNDKNNVLDNSNAADTTSSILWGGKGNDTMIGGLGADQFNFGAGDGNDVIQRLDQKDTIYFYDKKLSDLGVKADSNNNITFTAGAATLKIDATSGGITAGNYAENAFTVLDADDQSVKVMVGDKTGGTMQFVDDVKAYYGNSANKTLDGSTSTADMDIYLANGMDNFYESTMFSGVDNVNGGSGSNILRGNAGNNILDNSRAAAGTQSILWGGAGNDVMIGGAGADQFNFGAGDGNDTIKQSDSMDKVLLYSAKGVNDVTTSLTNGRLVLSMGNDRLTIEGWDASTGVNTFQFADGQSYQLDKEGKKFSPIA